MTQLPPDISIIPKADFRSRKESLCAQLDKYPKCLIYPSLPFDIIEGFFPHLVRKGNIRYFSNHEIEALHLIECLKKSGLGIKEINQFFSWVSEGSASFEKRKELFEARKEAVEAEIKSLQETLSLLEFKCWYYSKAMEDGTEEYIQAMLPDKLPSDIQKLYDASHK